MIATLLLVSMLHGQTPASGIVVKTCDVHAHSPAQHHPWIDPYGIWQYEATTFPAWDAFLEIEFRNESRKVAREIDFGLIVRGSLVATAKDVGKFSPGATIEHEFVVTRELLPLPATPYCPVLRVKYADGSVWVTPSAPQQ